jgi:hypothetical protein
MGWFEAESKEKAIEMAAMQWYAPVRNIQAYQDNDLFDGRNYYE